VVTEQVHASASGDAPVGVVDSASEEDQGSWLSNWGIKGITTVVEGTTSAMKKTGNLMQQTTGAVSKTVAFIVY
jgi:hypothetical protein